MESATVRQFCLDHKNGESLQSVQQVGKEYKLDQVADFETRKRASSIGNSGITGSRIHPLQAYALQKASGYESKKLTPPSVCTTLSKRVQKASLAD